MSLYVDTRSVVRCVGQTLLTYFTLSGESQTQAQSQLVPSLSSLGLKSCTDGEVTTGTDRVLAPDLTHV